MRLSKSLSITLQGVDSSVASHEVRVAIANAIVRSLKYNSYNNTYGAELYERYIESIDVDGESGLWTQYDFWQPINGPMVSSRGSTSRRLGFEKEDGVNATKKALGYYSEIAVTQRRKRDLSATWEVPATFHVISPDRWPYQWDRTIDMLMRNLESNIGNGMFNSFLYNASVDHSTVEYIHDGYTHRRLVTLPTAGAISSGLSSLAMQAFSVYGNAPTGQPTSAPSTSTPTTHKSRLETLGLYEEHARVSSLAAYPHILLWLIGILCFVGYSVIDRVFIKALLFKSAEADDMSDKKVKIGKAQVAPMPEHSIGGHIKQKDDKNTSEAKISGDEDVPRKGKEDDGEEDEDDRDTRPVERYLLAVLGLEAGMYQPDKVGLTPTPKTKAGIARRWVERIWYDMGIFHPVLLWLNTSTVRPSSGKMFNVTHLYWNRAVRGCFMLSYFSFSFTLLSLLMRLQYPLDDKSCLEHTTQQSCESIYKYWVSVYSFCEWKSSEGENYCIHREIREYDDRVLIMGALITALACAPLAFFIEYYFRLLLLDPDAPHEGTILDFMIERNNLQQDFLNKSHSKQPEDKQAVVNKSSKVLPTKDSMVNELEMGLAIRRERLHHQYYRTALKDKATKQEKLTSKVPSEGVESDCNKSLHGFTPNYLLRSHYLVMPHNASTLSSHALHAPQKVSQIQELLSFMRMVEEYRDTIRDAPSRAAFDHLLGIVPRYNEHHVNVEGSQQEDINAQVNKTNDEFEFAPYFSVHGRDLREPWEIWASFLRDAFLSDDRHDDMKDIEVDSGIDDGSAHMRAGRWRRVLCESNSLFSNCSALQTKGVLAHKRAVTMRRRVAKEVLYAEKRTYALFDIPSQGTATSDVNNNGHGDDDDDDDDDDDNDDDDDDDDNRQRDRGGKSADTRFITIEREREKNIKDASERLAQSLLGLEMIRSLFLDLLGRGRGSPEANVIRSRLDILLPSRHTNGESQQSILLYVATATLLGNLICFAISFVSVAYAQESFFMAWYLACIFYVAADLLIVQSNIALFLSTIVPAYNRGQVVRVLKNLKASCYRLWRARAPPGYRDEFGHITTPHHQASPGSYHTSKGMQDLLHHVWVSSRIARAHPLLLESRIIDVAEAEFAETLLVDTLMITEFEEKAARKLETKNDENYDIQLKAASQSASTTHGSHPRSLPVGDAIEEKKTVMRAKTGSVVRRHKACMLRGRLLPAKTLPVAVVFPIESLE